MTDVKILLVLLLTCTCFGQHKANKKCSDYFKVPAQVPKVSIVGGSRSRDSEFPHMVALGFGPIRNLQWLCGGTIISENYILTAAHCTNHTHFGPVKMVRIGVQNLKKLKPHGVDIEVSHFTRHPDYKPPSLYNDIALIELKSSVSFSKFIQPACLNTALDIRPRTNKLTATGWGLLSFGGDSSDELMKVELELYGNRQCRRYYQDISGRKLARGIDEALQLCAGGKNAEKDTCQGDSGGPLVFKTGSMYTIAGVTAFGKACGVANVPGVYTRVSAYVPWIEKIIWPQ